MTPQIKPKCLFFDVFGTCVDWRKSVTDALWDAARAALTDPTASIGSNIRLAATDMTYAQWGSIAQEWRNSYLAFVRRIALDPTLPFLTVDEHHLEALHAILAAHALILPHPTTQQTVAPGSLWTAPQLAALNLTWHRLTPWPDTNAGLLALNSLGIKTCTLSNGNIALLTDMVAHGDMPFTHIYSAEMFGSYKPSAKVYLGAAERMGLQPGECAMVAAHLDDLRAARGNGFATVYVERAREERHAEMREEAREWVDVWVREEEEGFVTVAERLKG